MKIARLGIQFIVVLALLAACGPQTREAKSPQLEKLEVAGVTNFTLLSQSSGFAGNVAGFGGTTQPSAMPQIRALGFVTVINLRLAAERDAKVENSRDAAQAAGLNFVHLPFNPADSRPEIVDEFLAAVGEAGNQPVYIHCSSATRAAALWMTARVVVDDWSVEVAGEEASVIAGRPEGAVELANSLIAAR